MVHRGPWSKRDLSKRDNCGGFVGITSHVSTSNNFVCLFKAIKKSGKTFFCRSGAGPEMERHVTLRAVSVAAAAVVRLIVIKLADICIARQSWLCQ